MKYGRLVYQYTGRTFIDKNAIYNIGDNIQTFAVDHFYEKMGIPSEDIIDINAAEMKNYEGEYVIVPIVGYASHYKRLNQLPPSDKIIPFFISFEMSDEECDDIISYLRRHEPIGCRDEATMNLLRRKGVQAYTSGCLTITLPRRKSEPKNGKVFFIDIPESLKEYVPLKYLENAEFVSHEGTIGHIPFTIEDAKEIDKRTIELVERYRNEASLVVTSRLHAASPCLAMGIPVILAIHNIDSRFSWLDKLIPIYDETQFNQIDWNPKPIYIEDLKEQIFNIFETNIKRLTREKADLYELSSFWENRTKACYNRVLQKRIEGLCTKYKKEDVFSYIIWGAGVHGKKAYYTMKETFPKAELVAIVDKYMCGESILGKPIICPEEVKDLQFDYAILTSHPGRFEAKEVMKSLHKKKGENWCYYISKDIPEEDEEN